MYIREIEHLKFMQESQLYRSLREEVEKKYDVQLHKDLHRCIEWASYILD